MPAQGHVIYHKKMSGN
uniref:Uncharacterized protein n=1 Tax=Rhizophora mucronata TaxID=61149 RepID=A0A2P2NWH6_RHIMU